MGDVSAVEMIIEPRIRQIGSAQVRRLLPYRSRRMVGPFIYLDVIGPETLTEGRRIDVDAHPHIGLATVTYLLSGRLVHRDSTGAVQPIEPGAVNWMIAGAGATHTERSHDEDLGASTVVHGVQTWVALPDALQDVEATFQHAAAPDVPVEQLGESQVRVVVGRGWDIESPVETLSPLILAVLSLVDGSPVRVDRRHPELAVLCLSGGLTVADRPLDVGQLAVLDRGESPTVEGSGTAILLGGEPVGSRHIWWNFVHSDADRIEAAKRNWLAQQFPPVPGDHDPYVPLPGDS